MNVEAAPSPAGLRARNRTRPVPGREVASAAALRGSAGIATFLALWQLGVVLHLPLLAKIPTPADVAAAWLSLLRDPRYYLDWLVSFRRVFGGFVIALFAKNFDHISWSSSRRRLAFHSDCLWAGRLRSGL